MSSSSADPSVRLLRNLHRDQFEGDFGTTGLVLAKPVSVRTPRLHRLLEASVKPERLHVHKVSRWSAGSMWPLELSLQIKASGPPRIFLHTGSVSHTRMSGTIATASRAHKLPLGIHWLHLSNFEMLRTESAASGPGRSSMLEYGQRNQREQV